MIERNRKVLGPGPTCENMKKIPKRYKNGPKMTSFLSIFNSVFFSYFRGPIRGGVGFFSSFFLRICGLLEFLCSVAGPQHRRSREMHPGLI